MKKGAFTLLEVIIVIIIIGVLASLALPRLFSMIEYSYSAEALVQLASFRSAMEKCYLMNNGQYSGCLGPDGLWEQTRNEVYKNNDRHFNYGAVVGLPGSDFYEVIAYYRKNGVYVEGNIIAIGQRNGEVRRCGSGIFKALSLSSPCRVNTAPHIVW